MKIHRKLSLLVTLCLLLSLLSSCGGDESSPDNESSPDIETTDIVFQSQATDLISIAVSPDAEVYGATAEDGIRKYNPAGDLLEEYPDTEYIRNLTYANGNLYGFDAMKRNIVELEPQSKSVRVVYESLPAEDVRSLTVAGNFVVLIVIPSFDTVEWQTEEDGFMDFYERFYRIGIESGELAEITAVKSPIALYHGSDGNLYVYAHPDGYVLYSYDVQMNEAIEISVMDDVKYLFGFAYEYGSFLYISTMNDVSVKRMSDGLIYVASDGIPVLLSGAFVFYKGSILFFEAGVSDQTDSEGQPVAVTTLRTLRLGQDTVTLLKGEQSENPGSVQEPSDNIVISAASMNQFFSTEVLNKRSGLNGVYSTQPINWDERQAFLTSILAGDDRVDIYFLHLQIETSDAIREMGGYVPLNDSVPIKRYLDSCFDWVGDAATAENGDTWMLPIYYWTPALWYVPENFERFDLTPDDVATFDSYYQTVDHLNQIKGDYTTHNSYIANMSGDWFRQYEMTYCDYDNKKAVFDTDIFRHYFETMYSGWNWYGDPSTTLTHHPVLQYDYKEFLRTRDSEGLINADLDADTVIFKNEYSYGVFQEDSANLHRWRALPLPRLTEDVKPNYVASCVYAFVNPYSKNKENAIAYLEAAAENMLAAVSLPSFLSQGAGQSPKTMPVFVQKDISAYDGYFDMSIPVYQDLYNTYRDGGMPKTTFTGTSEYNTVIEDYQAGKITLDEAVAEIQRQAEIWLNE